MDKAYKTVKEVAEELGVSKQTIRNKLDDEFRKKFVETIKIKGNDTLTINNEGYKILKKTVQTDSTNTAKEVQTDSANTAKEVQTDSTNTAKEVQTDSTNTAKEVQTDSDKIISLLEKQLERKEQQLLTKDKQIENKDEQILKMQNLLDQQQRLALQDKKLLEDYKIEIDKLKALNRPSNEQEIDINQEKIKKTDTRKWYQFWKSKDSNF